MRDTIAPEAPSRSAFTEFNVREEKGKPHFIRLHDSVVKRLERQLTENPASTGLLLGSIDTSDNCITVELFEPAAMIEELILAQKSSASPKIVGYYGSHSRDSFTLEAADRALFARCFPQESRLILLVKPPTGDVGTAMFFLGENGLLVNDRATVEFPLNLRALGAEDPPAISVATTPTVTESTRGPVSLLWKVGVAGVVVIASVFGLGELRVLEKPDAEAAPKQAVAASSAPTQKKPALDARAKPEIAKASTPVPAARVTAVKTQPAAPAVPPEPTPTPAPLALTEQRTMVAENSAPKTLVAFRQQPVETSPFAPVPETQLRPVTPVTPASLVQSPKRVQASLPYTPPNAIRQSAPMVSEKVRQSINGDVAVRVRVNVDAAGKVIGAEQVGTGSLVAEALADSAITAIKRWQFEPARRGGDKVPSDIVLSFTFRK